jgi:DNA polymerase-3 subunit gamma/tau
MGRALYRKYRPTSFEDAVGQEHITKTLKQAIKNGKISHAYLFTGPRGIGKTSVARILAHEVNSLAYEDDSIHLDIIEIDAASNRRIDEIRELRDKVHIAPTSSKYKVYIIDEVHMLTREAFNALLKTLEEPPAHCIFILATTEVHKLPETIISRTQRFSFKPADKQTLKDYLADIAKKEKISASTEALELLAEHGQGSFRDSMSLLDQLSTTGSKISADMVRTVLGLPAEAEITELIEYIKNGSSSELLSKLELLKGHGNNPVAIAAELSKQLRALLINGAVTEWIPALLRQLLDVAASTNPNDSLEITLLEAASKNYSIKPATQPPAKTQSSLNPSPKEPSPKAQSKADSKPSKTKEKIIAQEVTAKEEVVLSASFDMQQWPKVVNYAKQHAASLFTALRLAKPAYAGGTLTLYFQFPLHQKKLNQSKQKDIIGQIIEEVAGAKVRVECEVNKDMFKAIKLDEVITAPPIAEIKPKQSATAPLNSISNIFGNAEVLESN